MLGIAVNVVDFKMDLAEASAAPRLSQRNSGITQVDQGFKQTPLGQKLSTEHLLEPVAEIGAATGISVTPDGRLTAVAEPVRRGGGSAMTLQ
ncbi:gamma-glutamyltransferase [Leptolyngbya sp. BC1307]|uniref:gamma-glutamyltransferase n=1 Tax=Leptolyngbya sp. BC1307 TaxID=2029589 RepID=UPI001F0B5B77|nr:gamma-glutamyltransferase [Leptolyngbya sp. BC1307]